MKRTIIQRLVDEFKELEKQGKVPEDKMMRYFWDSYQDGIRQGSEQVRQARLEREQQKYLEMAHTLLDSGFSLDVVIKATGVSRGALENPRH